jgi:hypothetical protein
MAGCRLSWNLIVGSSSGNGILVRVGVLMCITVVIKALGFPLIKS